MSWVQVVYVVAGLVLPLYYVPQITRCWHDRTGLASYSMGKSGTQLMLRSLMMPFVYGVGDPTMSFIVSLDFAGRAAEYCAAVLSLRRQGEPWQRIVRRSLPFGQHPSHSGVAPWQVTSFAHYAVEPQAGQGSPRSDASTGPNAGASLR